jgi:hypothetical protein
MKRAGCVLAILGFLLSVGSLVLFGSSIFRAMAAREVARAPIEIATPFDSGLVTVETRKLVQVAIAAKVHSTHVRARPGSDGGLELEYRFPLRYKVIDEAGNVVLEEEVLLDSSGGTRSVSANVVTDEGGSERVEKSFAKFAVAPPGTIRVVAHLEEDTDFGARVEEPAVVVYDRVSKHAGRVAAGLAVLFLGGFAVVVGTALYIFAHLRSGSPPPAG